MAFDSFSALMHMSGHGPYVWTCYGVFFLLLGILVFWSMRQRRDLKRRLRRQWQLESRPREAGGTPQGPQTPGDFTPVDQNTLKQSQT